MIQQNQKEVRQFKSLNSLPSVTLPDALYYVLSSTTGRIKAYLTDLQGIPYLLFESGSIGGIIGDVISVTGTGVTGTSTNPTINIATFLSSQLGNRLYLSSTDGKLYIKPINSPNASIEVTETPTETQIKVAQSILDNIPTKTSDLINDSGFVTVDNLPSNLSLLRQEFNYVGGLQIFTLLNNYSQVYSVEVQGQGALSATQYNLITPNKVQIVDPLTLGDYIVILYGQVNATGINPYYTQAQTDNLIGTLVSENRVFNEIPIGEMNGINAIFTSSFDFVPGTVTVFLNGLFQRIISDFNTSGNNTITMTSSPSASEIIIINYAKLI